MDIWMENKLKTNKITVESPDKVMKAVILADNESGLQLSVKRQETEIIRCVIRLDTDRGRIGEKPFLVSEERNAYHEDYLMPAGKEPMYHHRSKECRIRFSEEQNRYCLIVRAFDEGVAYRIVVEGEEGQSIDMIQEPSQWEIAPGYDKAWLQKWLDTYEAPYHPYQTKAIPEASYGMPGLFGNTSSGSFLLLTEAELINTGGTYCSSHLYREDNGIFRVSFAPEQTEPVKAVLPAKTPWRVIMAADDLNDLLHNRMVSHLNPPSVVTDMDFIKPGRSLWSWWSFENGAQLYTEQKKYIDMAAAYGFESITVDAGWDDSWMEKLCRYGAEKGIRIWLWSDMQSLDSYEKAEPKIKRWAGWGAAGLKVDFFMNDSRLRMEQYSIIAELMTRYGLMINFHGNTKPAGESRTWPHLMTEEGIMGLEHYKWSDMPDAIHNCTVPFTRNVIGPMDYTPTGFSNENRNTTQGHQLALSIIYDSGIYHIAESIHSLLPWAGTAFLRRTHGAYDEMRLLAGYPGSHVVMLRRKGREWYLAGITDQARTVTIDCGFLPEEIMEVEWYMDHQSEDRLVVEQSRISNRDPIRIFLPDHGGFALYITDTITPLQNLAPTGFMTPPMLEQQAAGEKEEECFSLKGLTGGAYTVRLWYRAESTSIVNITNKKKTVVSLLLEQSGGIEVLRTAETGMELAGDDELRVRHATGGPVRLEKIQIIDNHPAIGRHYSALTARLEGKAQVLPIPDGLGSSVQNIGPDGSLVFDQILAEKAGEYLLAIDYYAGENKTVTLTVNETAQLSCVLFNTGGWETGNWNVLGRKEVLVNLKKGMNQVRFSSAAEGPHFDAITIYPE